MASISKCIFCGTDLTAAGNSGRTRVTREHVVSKRLIKRLGLDFSPVESYHENLLTGQRANLRTYTFNNFTCKGVCASCNAGWMAAIERDAIPIFEGFLRVPFRTKALSDAERRILSQWTFRTSICALYANRLDPKGMPNPFQSFAKDGQLPVGFHTFLGMVKLTSDPMKNVSFAFMPGITTIGPNGIQVVLPGNLFRFAITIGPLVLTLVFSDLADMSIVIEQATHRPLDWTGKRYIVYEGDKNIIFHRSNTDFLKWYLERIALVLSPVPFFKLNQENCRTVGQVKDDN